MPHPREALEFTLIAVTSVFFLVDPFALIPMFLAVTATSPPDERRSVACSLIFKLFGITLPAF